MLKTCWLNVGPPSLAQHLAFAGIATRQLCGKIDHPVLCIDIVFHTRVDIWSVIDNDPCNYTAGDNKRACPVLVVLAGTIVYGTSPI